MIHGDCYKTYLLAHELVTMTTIDAVI